MRRLEAASEFWERQPYMTRLYFGDGGLDYLHRSVLGAAISALDKAATLKTELAKLRQLVAQQAEDDGLWFNAATAPEAYLQQELRKLHAAIEGTK